MQKGRIIWLALSLLLFACLLPLSVNVAEAKINQSTGLVVIETNSKRILSSSNMNEKLFPASTTKVLTALTVIENVENLKTEFVVDDKAVGVEGSSIYLKKGDKRTFEELLYGLMLRSGNDSAVALAIATSKNVDAFVSLMNKTAKEIGAKDSNFKNPHGLHDDEHYTTAYDLALITAKALENETFKKIVSTKIISFGEGENKRYYQNKNKMLWQYEGANGVKTGYTQSSGRCLVSSAVRDGMQLICVALNCYNMWEESKARLTDAFNKYEYKPINEEFLEQCDVLYGKNNKVSVTADFGRYPIKKDGSDNFKIITTKKVLVAPFKENTQCGTVDVYNGNCLIFSGKLYTISGVEKKSLLDRISGK